MQASSQCYVACVPFFDRVSVSLTRCTVIYRSAGRDVALNYHGEGWSAASMLTFFRQLTLRRYCFIALGLVALVVLMFVYREIDIEAVHRKANEFNGVVVFALMVILPLLGFPVSVVHAVAGLRFGLVTGFELVAAATFLQLLIAYGLVKLAPGFFARRLEPLRKRLPEGAHTPVTLFTMLLPGVPYFAQLYVLPMIGVPLGTYLLWSLPINILRSLVGVTFGGLAEHMTPLRLAGFGLYTVTITLVCLWAFKRLRRVMKLTQPDPMSGFGTSVGELGATAAIIERNQTRRKRFRPVGR